jgi:GNAT superfamily N-acetyltransferase
MNHFMFSHWRKPPEPASVSSTSPSGWLAHIGSRIRDIWRWEGLVGLLWSITDRFLHPLLLLQLTYVFECDLWPFLDAPTMPDGFQLMLYTGERWIEALQKELCAVAIIPPELIRRRLATGGVVAVARQQDHLAGFSWLSLDPATTHEMEPSLVLQPGEVYQYDSFVVPEFRGHRLHGRMHAATAHFAREHGFTRAITYVDFWNRPSLKTQAMLGKRKVQTILALSLWWMKDVWCLAIGPRQNPRARHRPGER